MSVSMLSQYLERVNARQSTITTQLGKQKCLDPDNKQTLFWHGTTVKDLLLFHMLTCDEKH